MSLMLLLALLAAPAAREAPAPSPVTAAQIVASARDSSARVTLVNAWATWCVPCREEMPDILRLRRELASKGFDVALVSADFDDSIPEARSFLGGLGVDFRTFHKKQRDQDFIDGLDPSWSGALPFTILLDGDGRRLASWEGRESYAVMRERILAALKAGDKP